MVTSGGDRYAVPQISLLEVVRLKGAHAKDRIETIQGTPVYRLRGNLVPLVYLNRELQVEDDPRYCDPETVNIVVLQADNRRFGLVVDQVNDTEEIVVKPLGQHLKGITAFAGATIMGDGSVALILDVLGVARHANVITKAQEHSPTQLRRTDEDTQLKRRTMLLVMARDGRRMAIPLSTVARLEAFPRSSLELLRDQVVVQYRGSILPLFDIADLVSGNATPAPSAADSDDTVQVVVHGHGPHSVGMMVAQILDIVDEGVRTPEGTEGSSLAGGVVIQKKVTELIDLESVLLRSHRFPSLAPVSPAAGEAGV